MPMHQAHRFFEPLPRAKFYKFFAVAIACSALFVNPCALLAADTAGPDTLVFTNGDSLKGKLVSATNSGIIFNSDAAGSLTVSWDKVKTVDSKGKFAVLKTSQKVTRKTPATEIPQGTVAISNKNVNVTTPSGTTTISTSNTQAIIDAAAFQKTVYVEPGILHGYTGNFTLGIAEVESTQSSNTFNGALTLVRTVPNAAWIAPRNKTTLDASAIYGIQKQQANPALNIAFSSVKTDIIHGDFERDEYIKPRFYYLGYASTDHNYSEGLSLQYIFGGGFGYTVIKNAKQELDVKTDLHYEQQQFITAADSTTGSTNNNLIGMDFAETYMRKLHKTITLNETGVITPSFNNATATATVPNPGNPFSAAFTAGLIFPVYKNLGFNTGVIENYITDPAPGFNDNTFQFTLGATYTFK